MLGNAEPGNTPLPRVKDPEPTASAVTRLGFAPSRTPSPQPAAFQALFDPRPRNPRAAWPPTRAGPAPDRYRKPPQKPHPSRHPQISLEISLSMQPLLYDCHSLPKRTRRLPQPQTCHGRRRGTGGSSGTGAPRVTSARVPGRAALAFPSVPAVPPVANPCPPYLA